MDTKQLETIKKSLPYGYEKLIAQEVGCSQGTVHNILNNKHSSRSSYSNRVISVAARMAREKIATAQILANTAESLKTEVHGTAS